MTPGRPSDEEVLARAGAVGPGRILVRGDAGRVCMAVADTNADGAFLVVVTLDLDDDGVWRESAWSSAPVAGEGEDHGAPYSYGRAPAGSVVDVPCGGRVHRVRANAHGWWLALGEADAAVGTAD